MIIDGRKIAEEIHSALKARPAPPRFLGVVVAGEDARMMSFVNQKKKVAGELGVDFRIYAFPANAGTEELCREVGRLAGQEECGGLVVQLPLPDGVDTQRILNAIPKEKDPDLLSEAATNAFRAGRSALLPPAVGVVDEIIKREGREKNIGKAVVIGKGTLVGKPVAFWLQSRAAELAIFDIETENVRGRLSGADLVVSGAGAGHLFSAADLKDGALVVDFGTSEKDGKIVGDFDPRGGEERRIAYTPTPHGTGPILVAKLFENFYALNDGAR